MHRHYPGQRPVRPVLIVLMAAGFVAVLTVTAGLLFQWRQGGLNLTRLFPNMASTDTTNEPLFYRSIGQASSRSLEAPPSASADSFAYTLEIAVAPSRDQAEKIVQDLQSKNIETFYSAYQQDGVVQYHVRRGVFTSAKRAEVAAKELEKVASVRATVVRLQ